MLFRARCLLVFLVLVVLAALALGCGSREQLVGLPDPAGAGGAPDAPPPDPPVCREDGLPCQGAADCCSAACAQGICGGDSCARDGAPCAAPGDCCAGLCTGGLCGQGCSADGAPCQSAAACCAGVCMGGACGRGCFRDGSACGSAGQCCSLSCVEGACRAPCIPNGARCSAGDACCSGACVAGACAEACAPDGSVCGQSADCCTGRCNAGICGGCSSDGVACGSADACCSGVCAQGVCGGAACSHAPCEIGAPLAADCGGGAAELCRFDPFCCTTSWDEICVGEVPRLCGLVCVECAADGSRCASGEACCSGACEDGVCRPPCARDGQPCADSGECCNGSCQNGLCGGPACPSDGTGCGGCVAERCCAQLSQCLLSPTCADDVACFFGCLDEGSGPAVCGFQCIHSPETLQLLRCVGRSCGGGTCF
ncbi:hypothetical protein WME95_10035 [Sorangium sp. So ce327]|uniref:hypothetical protein n=1 Tax=Sorangium sp. So ce327 TaxID=3133301 RepID=UPI003F62AEFF